MLFAIIGSGNVATHFAIALVKNGHQVLQVWSRDFTNAQTLAQKVSATAITSLSQIHSNVEVIIIAVNDDAVSIVLNGLNTCFPKKYGLGSCPHEQNTATLAGLPKIPVSKKNGFNPIFIHTSGTLNIDVLSANATNYGVLYPIQTLSKNVAIDFLKVPIAVEGNNQKVEDTLLQIAKSISNLVYKINSNQRKTLHIAAVFACNFTNYFYAIAEDLLQQYNLSFDMLKPLITETANKIIANPPQHVQTGPAKRNDESTMDAHLSALSQHPNYQMLYKLISDAIVAKCNKD
ncbi:MAG: DUF2520 domain-containing protein [Sphingobacteriales bacterium]|nr:MAG: DUF2520 domain-containing protein [Sphingobacteriales bacterium]